MQVNRGNTYINADEKKEKKPTRDNGNRKNPNGRFKASKEGTIKSTMKKRGSGQSDID